MARILIVEDDAKISTLLARTLARQQYDVTSAEDGETALAQVRQARPDLVLMDISLPGLDGLEVTRRLKADPATQDIPVLALTGHALAGDRELCLAAGCDDYESKPLDLERVVTKIGRLLERRSRMDRMRTRATPPDPGP